MLDKARNIFKKNEPQILSLVRKKKYLDILITIITSQLCIQGDDQCKKNQYECFPDDCNFVQ
jgi:hypothetical protein